VSAKITLIGQPQGLHLEAVLAARGQQPSTGAGGHFYVGQGLAEMGRSVFTLGNDTEAERVWRESLRIATEIHGTPVALEALVGLASLRAKRGDIEPALELLLIVLNHPASSQETKNRAEILRVELESRLTPQQIQAVQAQARKQSFDQVVSQFLGQPLQFRYSSSDATLCDCS
jgi:hypothetical protein